MTKMEVNDMKNRLDAKCHVCGGVRSKYKDAFREGVKAAQIVLDRNKNKDDAMEELRKLLNSNMYLSGEKTEAFRKAIRAAMSMLHNIED